MRPKLPGLRTCSLEPPDIRSARPISVSWLRSEYDQAIAPIHKALEGDSSPRSRTVPHAILGAVYEQKGMYDEAIADFRDAVGQSGGFPVYVAQLAHAQAASGNRAEALRIVEELKRLPKDKYVPPDEIAAVYAALQQKETAFEWLEQAYQVRSGSLINLKVDPRFDSLRSDQRFADLVRRIGLPE
jgi:tetratricopeptide (TPR) repeat protein